MSLNETVSAERIHIGFFGLRNAGKSSVVNAVTGQSLSVVSSVKGTTTDPVKKSMELLPLGPVTIIDTPGFDDEGELGQMRVTKTKQTLSHTDIAVLVVDSTIGYSETDRQLIELFNERQIPFIVALNKSDLLEMNSEINSNEIYVSAVSNENINELKEKLADFGRNIKKEKYLIADIISPGDTVILVIPVDSAAPKGRLILPQQQVLRELLDFHCTAVCCQDTDLSGVLESLKDKPKLVITDSQAFEKVSRDTPDDILLTSFSIIFARYKGNLDSLIDGADALKNLKTGDKVLISEGCTHHRQCEDIGTVKMPNWIRKFTNCEPDFMFTSGNEFPENLSEFKLIVHCGACMLNEREMTSRVNRSKESNVPIVNYGVAIAHMHGILERSLVPFKNKIS